MSDGVRLALVGIVCVIASLATECARYHVTASYVRATECTCEPR